MKYLTRIAECKKKCGVELLGTGKTAEVSNVVLPFAIHTTLNRMIGVQRQLNMKIMGVSV